MRRFMVRVVDIVEIEADNEINARASMQHLIDTKAFEWTLEIVEITLDDQLSLIDKALEDFRNSVKDITNPNKRSN